MHAHKKLYQDVNFSLIYNKLIFNSIWFYFGCVTKLYRCFKLLSSPKGTLVFTDHHITVTHTFGKYTLKLFDHIGVKVNVEHGHTHPHSFSLELLSTVPIPMGNNSNVSDWCNKPHSNPDLVKVMILTTVPIPMGKYPRPHRRSRGLL